MVAFRFHHEMFQSVDAAKPLSELVGGELSNSLAVTVSKLPAPGQVIRAGSEPQACEHGEAADRRKQDLPGGIEDIGSV